LRVIGGRWRGTILSFPPVPGLRPTSDRVRETLFNWLQPVIAGARCLDLFAGSGALGFEAASRGAAAVVMVEQNRLAVAGLRFNSNRLGASVVRVVQADALQWLRRERQVFDVVFLDPPFGHKLLPKTLELLSGSGRLADGAHVYMERERVLGELALPPGWELFRAMSAGAVACSLARVARDGPATQTLVQGG
jgi:16S rRNA (guanine966-N2)-methyltransferase